MALDDNHSLLEALTLNGGLEQLGRFYGVYRALVTRIDDPDGRGRVQAICPQAGHAAAPDVWIDPAQGGGDNRGIFWPPEVGDTVYVAFENGWPGRPRLYIGGWYAADPQERPAEFAPDDQNRPRRRGMITRGGHTLVFDDSPGAEAVTLSWHATAPGDESLTDVQVSADRTRGRTSSVTFNKDGGIVAVDAAGSQVAMDGAGQVQARSGRGGAKVTLTADKLEVDAPRINHGAAASQAHLRGTEFRARQATLHSAMQTVCQTLNGLLTTMGTAATKAATSPALLLVAGDAAASFALMGTTMIAAAAQFQTLATNIAAFEAAAAGYLSPVTFTK